MKKISNDKEELKEVIKGKNVKIDQQDKELNTICKQSELNEQLKKETGRKTKQIEELSQKLEESNEMSNNMKIKLQVSCENVNDLAEDIRFACTVYFYL